MSDFCSPQRYLANNRNVVRTATLTPSSVLPVVDTVLELGVPREGTGQVLLTGPYSGEEEATYDIEVLDNVIDAGSEVISTPVGPTANAGSGTLQNITSSGPPQCYTVQLQNAGIPQIQAGLDVEGVRVVARAIGDDGNGITIDIDQTTLTFTEANFSLLVDLEPGDGGETTGLKGPAFEWDTKVLSADNIIPANAHRVAFGNDHGAVYLAYKRYVEGEWFYHFVPEIKRRIPKGTRISFVTDGRAITVTPLVGSPETVTGIITVYDFLNWCFTTSALVTVEGVIAFDRSPTGQAAKELLLRTDAHCEPSTGTGSDAAQDGFVDTFANANASTELVIAKCVAVTAKDHPLARVTATRWDLNGSVSGPLGTIVEGVPYVHPDGKFGLTIKQIIPANSGVQVGRFTHTDTIYEPRDDALKPPICPKRLTLGSEAVDQTITLEWTRRPSGDCACKTMSTPPLNLACLGLTDSEGTAVSYQPDTVAKVTALYAYKNTILRFFQASAGFAAATGNVIPQLPGFVANSKGVLVGIKEEITQPEFTGAPDPDTGIVSVHVSETIAPHTNANAVLVAQDGFIDVIARFENVVATIDPLNDDSPGTYRSAGMTAWDAAFAELQSDWPASGTAPLGIDAEVYYSKLEWVLASAGLSPLGGADASIIVSGDGCWRDYGGDYWTVVGSEKGAYAPLFNNKPYIGSRLAEDGKTYFSTYEFGLVLAVACENLLVYGDQVILTIGDAGRGSVYQLDDEMVLPVLAAQPLVLAGGQDGNKILDFYVTGTVDGSKPNFLFNPDDSPPASYNEGGLIFDYVPGGIPNEAGDKWEFCMEGGHWRYRKNGGGWIVNSPSDDIDDDVLPFDSGLSIQWRTGASPSFVPGDRYSFRVFQPWAVSNLKTPNRDAWRWNEANPSVVIDCGESLPITGLALYRHTLPAGATILVEGGDAPGVYLWDEALTWQVGDIFKEVDRSARYLRLSFTNAAGAGSAHFWAGVPVTTTKQADVELGRVFKMESGTKGLVQGGNYLGKAYSGRIVWSEAKLTEQDLDAIDELIDWSKTHGDEPFLLVPNATRPQEMYAAILAVDQIDYPELSWYNRDAAFERKYSIALPFAGVWRH
jgi:hypothetical protein